MIRGCLVLMLLLALSSCRTYDYYGPIADGGGLVPGDQLARYGREQAQAVAIARRFAENDASAAVAFARTQPDVVNAVADPLSHRIAVDFKSGWRLGVVPLAD
jgi:hypothetical protein